MTWKYEILEVASMVVTWWIVKAQELQEIITDLTGMMNQFAFTFSQGTFQLESCHGNDLYTACFTFGSPFTKKQLISFTL